MQKSRKGRFYKAANGRNVWGLIPGKPELTSLIAHKILPEKFGFHPSPPIAGLDSVDVTCVRQGIEIMVSWDNWSGCFIWTDTGAGDPLFKKLVHIWIRYWTHLTMICLMRNSRSEEISLASTCANICSIVKW